MIDHEKLSTELLTTRARVLDAIGNTQSRRLSKAVSRFQTALDHLRFELSQEAGRRGAIYWQKCKQMLSTSDNS